MKSATGAGNKGDLIEELDELTRMARKEAETIAQGAHEHLIVAFFDLSGSTAAKLASGNAPAVRDALAFTTLASSICTQFRGRVLKTLGDGALAIFTDSMAACRAALNLRYATHEFLRLEMTAGLTSGRPLRIVLDGHNDVLGDVVDRAARIQAQASPGQVLLDGTLRNQVRADIAAERAWEIDATPRLTHAKGVGPIELYELSLKNHWKPKKELATPFIIDPSGRPSISEKLSLIRNANNEIIEVGIGLTSFAQYFEGQKPNEFRDPIRQLIRGGVDLKCFALDPTYEAGTTWLAEQAAYDYAKEAEIARGRLERESKYCRDNHYRGKITYCVYRRVPEFWCLGVDVDDDLDGRMFFQPYLMGVARSATPVVQVSRTSNPELYEKYLQSIRAVRDASDVCLL
jgi:class 3 adenylate cyclase